MRSLPQRIIDYAESLPEATPLCPAGLLHLGKRAAVELRHAPRWQLAAPHRKAGDVIRALAWLGPKEVDEGLEAVLPMLSAEDFEELSAARAIMPIWMAEPLSARIVHA